MKKSVLVVAGLAGVLIVGAVAWTMIGGGLEPVDLQPATLATLPKVAPGDWPWWRGPNGDARGKPPTATKWTETENVVWKTNVPGRGHSSPIVWGERVYLTSADEENAKQLVLAYERKTGKPLWSTTAHEGGLCRMHQKNSHASATPACDGERVYSAFINRDGLHVTATDLDGKIAWQTKAGGYKSEHGYGSSLALYRGLVIVSSDSLKGNFIAALDRGNGKHVWRTERKSGGRHGSYATPIVATVAGKPQLILTGKHEVTSYNPDTGELIWSCAGPAEVTANTVACSDTLVFAAGGYPEKELLAIRGDGAGDVTKSHVVWRAAKASVTYVPSPLYHAGHLYVVNDNGVASCLKADDGTQLWQQRLPGSFSSSPVLVGELLYVTNEAGKTFVLKTGTKYELVAGNDLADGGFATPTSCGGQLFLRTNRSLYCIGERH